MPTVGELNRHTVFHFSNMNALKKTLLIGVLLFSCVGCDQVAKDVARDHLRYAPPVTLLAWEPGYLSKRVSSCSQWVSLLS